MNRETEARRLAARAIAHERDYYRRNQLDTSALTILRESRQFLEHWTAQELRADSLARARDYARAAELVQERYERAYERITARYGL